MPNEYFLNSIFLGCFPLKFLFISWVCLFVNMHFDSNVFQLPEGRMLTFFGIVPEGSLLDVPNAALGTYLYRDLCVLWVLPKSSNTSF